MAQDWSRALPGRAMDSRTTGTQSYRALGELMTDYQDRTDDAKKAWTGDKTYTVGDAPSELHPSYYQTASGLDPWDVVKAFNLDYWRGTAVVYLLRAGRKFGDHGGNG